MCTTVPGFLIWVLEQTQISGLYTKHFTDLATFVAPSFTKLLWATDSQKYILVAVDSVKY